MGVAEIILLSHTNREDYSYVISKMELKISIRGKMRAFFTNTIFTSKL